MWHDNWIKVAQRGFHEEGLERFLVSFLREGDAVLDVGAQIGMVSSIAAKLVGPTGIVHSFEPDPTNRGCLFNTIAQNALGNVEVHPHAVGNSCGVATFRRPSEGWGAFAVDSNRSTDELVSSGAFPDVRFDSYDVQQVTLDTWAKAHDLERLTLVKIDVDGPEVNVLEGATEVLATHKPVVVVEASRYYADHGKTVSDLFSVLHRLGYGLHGAGRSELGVVSYESPTDLSVDLSRPGSALNFFCWEPGAYRERLSQLPLRSARGL